MIDEPKEELAALYALGLLEDQELARFQAELAHEPALRQLVAELAGTASQLAHTAPTAEPPAALKARLAKGERLWEAHRTHFYQRALTNGFDVGQVIGRVVLTNVVLLLLAAATVAVPDTIVAGLALAAGIAVVTFVLAQFSRPRPPRDLPHRVR